MALYLSASLLKEYVSCNRKVYYRTNRPDIAIQNIGMIVGEIVHKAIELYWNNQEGSYEYMLSEMKRRLPNEPTNFASDCLYVYHNNFSNLTSEEDSVEVKFKLPYEKDVFIVGMMDRITVAGNILDWKTEANPPSNISNEIQFILYNWAYKRIYNKEPSGVYFASLRTGHLVKLNYDAVKENILVNEIIPLAIKDIRNKNYVRNGIFRKGCYKCQYSNTCLADIGGSNVVDNSDPT